MKRKFTIAVSATIVFFIMLSYQNCGLEPVGTMFDPLKVTNLPYETSIDQLAYMSCAEQLNVPNPENVFFTFRVGAYTSGGGLRLSEKFWNDTRKKDQRSRLEYLATDGVANSRLQFALRQRTALYRMFSNGDSGGGVEEQDYDFVFGDFGSEAMSAALLNQPLGAYMNYFSPAGVNRDAYFEGSLVFNTSEALAEQTRKFLNQNGFLALTYADVASPANIKLPSDYNQDTDGDGSTGDTGDTPVVRSDQAIGTGLQIKFTQPNPANWYSGSVQNTVPQRVLSSVTEFNLENPAQPRGNWNCPREMQFRIVFPDDAECTDPGLVGAGYTYKCTGETEANQLCPIVNDPASLSNELALIRRTLPAADWYVNLARRCIIPKRYTMGSCYGVDTGPTPDVTRTVRYWFINVAGQANCNSTVNDPYVCPHFMSVCFKR